MLGRKAMQPAGGQSASFHIISTQNRWRIKNILKAANVPAY
jgi:hypothetical protein